jgi:rubrerythrin
MSMIDNLRTIEKLGIQKFIRQEQHRWKCSHCGNLVSVHRSACLSCGAPKATKVKRRSL